jgi:hypothetical protein
MVFENTNYKLTVRSHPEFGQLGFPTGRDGFISLRCKYGVPFRTDDSTVGAIYITTYFSISIPKRPTVGEAAVSSNRHFSQR